MYVSDGHILYIGKVFPVYRRCSRLAGIPVKQQAEREEHSSNEGSISADHIGADRPDGVDEADKSRLSLYRVRRR